MKISWCYRNHKKYLNVLCFVNNHAQKDNTSLCCHYICRNWEDLYNFHRYCDWYYCIDYATCIHDIRFIDYDMLKLKVYILV